MNYKLAYLCFMIQCHVVKNSPHAVAFGKVKLLITVTTNINFLMVDMGDWKKYGIMNFWGEMDP